jgi:hypothetical protein
MKQRRSGLAGLTGVLLIVGYLMFRSDSGDPSAAPFARDAAGARQRAGAVSTQGAGDRTGETPGPDADPHPGLAL